MKKDTLVSVIIPTYNCEQEVSKCIYSVMNQTYKNVEIIVIDDCSSDNTVINVNTIKEQNAKRDIKVFLNEHNMGVSHSRNVGLKNATGKYIMFLDGDDYIEEDTIERTINFAVSNNLDIVKFNFVKDIYGISLQNDAVFLDNQIFFKEDFKCIYLKMIEGYSFSSCCFQLIKKELTDNLQFNENLTYGEDLLFCLELYSRAISFGYNSNCFYHYVIKNNSITREINVDKKVKILMDSICVYSKYYEYLDRWHMQEYKTMFDRRYKNEINSCLNQIIICGKYSQYKKICLSINKKDELKNSGIYIKCSYAKFFVIKLFLKFKNLLKKVYARLRSKTYEN